MSDDYSKPIDGCNVYNQLAILSIKLDKALAKNNLNLHSFTYWSNTILA